MAASKSRTPGNPDGIGPVVPFVKYDTGILTVKRTVDSDLPPMGSEIVLNVHSTIIDRFEGTAHTEIVWGDKPNLRVITLAAVTPDVRQQCAEFFLQRKINPVLRELIQPRMVRPADVMITKADLHRAISAATANVEVTGVIMELLVAYLTKVGIVSSGGNYSRRVQYAFEPVTTETIAHDVAMFEIVRVMENAKLVMIADRKYSKEAFAEEVGDALYEIGRAFLDVNSLSTIMDDIVKGIRAHIDLRNSGLVGAVDNSWRDNDVVATLATNWVFIKAALLLPIGSSITPSNDGWKLDKFAPIIMAALKSSQRYAIVGKIEATRNMGSRRIRNIRGRPVSVVLWRSAKPDPVGMSVYAYEDSVLPGAYTLTATRERLGEVVAAAYGRSADLGTDGAAKMLISILTDAAEGGFEDANVLYQIDLGGYATIENQTLVALMAERVVVAFDDNGLVVTEPGSVTVDADVGGEGRVNMDAAIIKMWYTIKTSERDLSWGLSGRFDGGTYLTGSVAEAFLVMDEMVPSSTIEAKPQLYTAAAFNTRIVNFDPVSVISVDKRFTFSVEVNDAKVHGAFRPSDLGSMKSNPHTSLVVPVYNWDVFTTVAQTFEAMLDVTFRMKAQADKPDAYPDYTGGTALAAYLQRRIAKDVLDYAQLLAPAFRAEVHRGMMSRATLTMTMEESLRLRAKLAQRAFGAYADVVALSLFMDIQGMSGQENSFWKRITGDQVMAQTYFEIESDRPQLAL